jgi:DNA invertase Pin-like site-specific DNA recombinase
MNVQYIRVSTVEQNIDRQTRVDIEKVFIDKISGTTKLKDRPEGKKLLKLISDGKITTLTIHSLDRLGRSLSDTLETVKYLTEKKVCLISEKEGIRTLNSDGSINPMANLLIGVLGTFAEFEINRSKERQAEGIAAAKLKGMYDRVGRNVGTIESKEVFMSKKKNQKILKYLKKGFSQNETAKLCAASINLVKKVRELNI